MKMKKLNLLIVVYLLFFISIVTAQEKVKGNRVVTIEERELSEFSKIEISNNFDVFISESSQNELSVEADENLHSYIITDVEDGVLKIFTSSKIIRKNKLNIILKLTNDIEYIEVKDTSKLITESIFKNDTITIKANNNSELKLNLSTLKLNYIARDNTSANFTLNSKEADINISGSSKLKGNISIDSLNINLINSAVFNVSGSVKNVIITADNNILFKGKDLKINNAKVTALSSSDIFINATDILILSLENSSEVYIFANPTITIEKFLNKASIHKKDY